MAHLSLRKPRRLISSTTSTLRGADVLQHLLAELALVLLPRGMTPKRFAALARAAFVQAASDVCRLQNGRVNHSRVAALTGVTREEVKRLLKNGGFLSTNRGQAPVERVIDGWRTDREFVIQPGQPRSLPISGRRGSFARLAKKYGGGVPYRAGLNELRRIGAVREADGKVEPRRSRQLADQNNFAFLSPALPALVDLIRISHKKSTSKASSIQRLAIPVETEVDLAIARERCVSSAQSMLDGLAHSLGRESTVSRNRRRGSYSYTVTIVLAENQVKQTQRTS